MTTGTSIIREEEHGWGDLLRPLFDMFGKLVRRGARRDLNPIDLWADDPNLREAISAVRMAAYPGEEYEDVAVRIDEELARYRKFLRNPTPIGKITLNTKWLCPNVCRADAAADKYQVHDPVEGRAHVSYSIDRFPDLVLEFVVHDKNDVPLFPIARTYSDWVGQKSFDLGAGRTFDLHMAEGECAAKVRVRAGITSADSAWENCSDIFFASEGLPLAAGEDGRDRARKVGGACGRSYGSRLALAFGIECVILFAFGWAYLRPPALTTTPTDSARAEPFSVNATTVHTGGATLSREEATRFLVMDGEAPFSWRKAALNAASDGAVRGPQRKRGGDTRGLTRIAGVSGGRVRMDAGFCDRVGDLCNQWRASMQSAYDAMKGVMHRRAGASADLGPDSYTEAVLVSYPSAGTEKGRVQVTLLLADAFFLLRGTDCTEFDGAAKGSTDTIAARLPETGLDMCRGTESFEQPAGVKDSMTAETRVRGTDAE